MPFPCFSGTPVLSQVPTHCWTDRYSALCALGLKVQREVLKVSFLQSFLLGKMKVCGPVTTSLAVVDVRLCSVSTGEAGKVFAFP